MAFYPAEDFKLLTASEKEDMENQIAEAMEDGYYPVGPWRYNSKQSEYEHAYVQTVVKLTNTDAQYIAALVSAFQPLFNSVTSQLATMNAHLAAIEQNTEK